MADTELLTWDFVAKVYRDADGHIWQRSDGFAAGIEAAARIADDRASGFLDCAKGNEANGFEEEARCNRGQFRAARDIASAVRALTQEAKL